MPFITKAEWLKLQLDRSEAELDLSVTNSKLKSEEERTNAYIVVVSQFHQDLEQARRELVMAQTQLDNLRSTSRQKALAYAMQLGSVRPDTIVVAATQFEDFLINGATNHTNDDKETD